MNGSSAMVKHGDWQEVVNTPSPKGFGERTELSGVQQGMITTHQTLEQFAIRWELKKHLVDE